MMRLAVYAGASAALAATVFTSAFYQRANFYAATVYLSQSNLCLMILVNLIFLAYGSLVYGLQRLCFGPLRPVEVEQLYEKAWFAVTETCLAMTVFREEVGAFFLVMFTALITGKVWGWIGEGRVEVLEQQPPANPRLFHTRMVVSLAISVVYNCWLLSYAVHTVIATAKPTMMVMFLFEFAVLAVGSLHTANRYAISLVEASVVQKQTRLGLEQRRAEVARERENILRRRAAGEIAEGEGEPLPDPEEVEEMDIDVPGWDAKGQWILFLDLVAGKSHDELHQETFGANPTFVADFLKLSIYTAFFCVLLLFYGLPIHIMRDLFITTRSFVKRLTALLKYKQALKDMNRYPDATAEELGREDTCIICREEMRPWDPNAGQLERHRPKKLPCGHILHFGCLKSWLERQQVCPTCRSSVVAEQQPRNRQYHRMAFHIAANNGQNQAGGAAGANGQAVPGVQDAQLNGQAGQAGQAPAAPRAGMRYINLGPIRLGFAQGGQEVAELANRMGMDLNDANAVPIVPQGNVPAAVNSADLSDMDAVRNRLLEVDRRIQQEVRDIQQGIQNVQSAQHELQLTNLLLAELARVRQVQNQLQPQQPSAAAANSQPGQPAQMPTAANNHQPAAAAAAGAGVIPPPLPPMTFFPQGPFGPPPLFPPPFPHQMGPHPHLPRMDSPTIARHGAAANTTSIPAGSPDLPEGIVLPPGWSLLPLQRLDQAAPVPAPTPAGVPTGPRTGLQNLQERLRNDVRQADSQVQQPSASIDSTTAPVSDRAPTEPVTAQVEVAAPTPLTPNWGGSAQLFGGVSNNGSSSSLPFGLQTGGGSVEASSRSASQTREASSISSNNNGEQQQQQAPAGTSAAFTDGYSATPTATSSSKGKAPAATVEDAVEEES